MASVENKSTHRNSERSKPLIPYSSLFIDASWWDFIAGAAYCLRSDDAEKEKYLRGEIETLFQTPGNSNPALVCLSVRTAFDLFLRVIKFPPRSEIIMSAINIPGMVDIVHKHDLIAVPWDVRPDTLAPDMSDFEGLITVRTKAVVVAHLFGKRLPNLENIIRMANQHNLLIIEDCAEAFDFFQYLGDPRSDLILFSFGVVKYFTAFGGGVCKVRDRGLHEKMRDLYQGDSRQPPAEYLTKIYKYSWAAAALNSPFVTRLGVRFFNAIGIDYKQAVVAMLRGFPPGDDFWTRLRRRPCVPLLFLLRRRLRGGSENDLNGLKNRGLFVRKLLSQKAFTIPGETSNEGQDWLFPIVVENPDIVVRKLNALGVEAFSKATQLVVVNPDNVDQNRESPESAKKFMDHVVYLPIHKNVPYSFLFEICSIVNHVTSEKNLHSTVVCKSKL